MSGAARPRGGIVERTVNGLLHAMERAMLAEANAAGTGWLQQLDPRVKLAGLLLLATSVAMSHRAWVIAALFGVGIALSIASRFPLRTLLSSVWLATLAFSSALALPAIVLTPGRSVGTLPIVGLTVTAQGLTTAGYLVLRVAATATLGFLLVFTTRWAHVLKALRAFRVPVVFVVILGMTYRYILLLLEAAHDMFEARRSRTVGPLTGGERRRLVTQGAGVLLAKSLHLSGEVFLAMQARGFRGEVYLLDRFVMARADWIALASCMAVAAAAVWAGR